ncbi:MAG: adenylate/guanylate cyclase domain-containing protein [Burkholderiaceae bacterium]|nr:adenylate/guanylate cyclase domain-containing protein [Sulfuritalea sp.]MCF8175800.1 adenylate/guanylate cyclase domain-containing protein [Burkholderiaceae bacterium]MCF8184043.1 adenylate/guanylate cyclase domain-containing protein [Polynucleobacter sp.]
MNRPRWLSGESFRKVWQFLAVAVLALLISLGSERLGWLQDYENIYYDYWHQLSGQRRVAQHAAVIAVDDDTLLQYKDDPLAFWAPHFARAMQTLTDVGVKSIGLDFIYAVSAEAWLHKLNLPDSEVSRNYDAPFRAQLAQGGKILIAQLVETSQGDMEVMGPPQDHLLMMPNGAYDTGIANLYPDSDKLVRTFYPVVIPDPEFPGVGFAMQLVLRATEGDSMADGWTIAGETFPRTRERRRIGYVGPPGSMMSVSMSKLLKADALDDPDVQALKGRVVIIAPNNIGTSDRHFSPYSRVLFGHSTEPMIGGEIHANVIETILSGTYPRDLTRWAAWPALVAVLFVAVALFLRMHPAGGLGVGFGLSLLMLVPAYALFQKDLLLSVAPFHVALATAYLATLALRLTGEERQRAHLRSMFGQYVSDVVVDKLIAEGQRPNLSGEKLQVSILFSDIRNFTTISEKLDAEEVVEMLNAYFSLACEPILEQGGMVNKFIGDAVMAVFGSPVHYDDHARRALLAAQGMAREAERFKVWMEQRFPDRGLPEFAIGVGVHSGPAVMGDIGSLKRREFTAIGDTVNAASRLEGATKELGCIIAASAASVSAAGGGISTGRREVIHVKGKAEPIEVFEVLLD